MATESRVVLNPTTMNGGPRIATTTDGNGDEIQKVTLAGLTDGGVLRNIPVTPEGHMEVAIHSPRLPFGSLHAENLTPVMAASGVYGVNTALMKTTTGLSFGTGANTGAVTSENNLLICSTGTTAYSFAMLQSRRRVHYRPGQGIVARFTALFSAPVANSVVVGGVGTAEAGFFFGYNGTSFGILHSTGGVREVHTLTITTASTATNDYVVTLPNGTTANVTATANMTTTRTAYEISKGTFTGYDAEASGSTVVFVAKSAGPVSGSFSLAQTGAIIPAAGTDVETLAGVAPTNTWIAQTDWNGDVMDGSGSESNPSGILLDKTKGNIYQIGVQYLGFGAITFGIETAPSDANNPEFVTVHTIRSPNSRTSVTISQPAFPFTMAAYSSGSSTNVSISVASFAAFIEGNVNNLGPRSCYFNTSAITSSTTVYTPILTIRNGLSYKSRANQIVSHLLSVTGAARSTTGLTTFFLIRDATLTGPTNFAAFSTNSASDIDTGSTRCSFTDAEQVIWVGATGESSDFQFPFIDTEITLQPGETLTLAVRSVTATATCVGAVNMREDQ